MHHPHKLNMKMKVLQAITLGCIPELFRFEKSMKLWHIPVHYVVVLGSRNMRWCIIKERIEQFKDNTTWTPELQGVIPR